MKEQRVKPVVSAEKSTWCDGRLTGNGDQIAAEEAVALVYNGISHVVMMATPLDLEDFALGFSITEGILDSPKQLLDIEVEQHSKGIELHVQIAGEAFTKLKDQRRNLTGRTGCGLCGAEALDQAVRLPQPVTKGHMISHQSIQSALSNLSQNQLLQKKTGAVHAAALCNSQGEIVLLREDVGRHNALDKVLGALAASGPKAALQDGFIIVTSRASYEMVSKVAMANQAILVAVSAPTARAVELADQCAVTLVGFARPGSHSIYSHGQRLGDSADL